MANVGRKKRDYEVARFNVTLNAEYAQAFKEAGGSRWIMRKLDEEIKQKRLEQLMERMLDEQS